MASCFPDGPERERRKGLAEERWARFVEVERRWKQDPKSVPDEALDEAVDRFGEGFRKLAEAQKRDRCVFQTAVGLVTFLPHAQVARYVVRVIVCKARRERDRGEIDAAISDAEAALRLTRDLRPRGCLIRHLVAGIMSEVIAKDVVLPILAAPALRLEHCDRLLSVLGRHEEDSPDAENDATAARIEYITARTSILLAIQAARREGSARPTPEGLDRQVDRVNAYFRSLLALKDVPYAQRLSRLPEAAGFFPADDDHARLVVRLLPEFKSFIAATGRVGATLHAAECLIALRRWQITHAGALPGDLASAFRDAGRPAVPTDPFDGKAMRLVFVEGTPVVHSVGKDGRDDGGLRDSDSDRREGDLIFRLPPSR